VEACRTESRGETGVDPDCGPWMNDGASCSGTGAHGMSGVRLHEQEAEPC
jgi:hypothetical protein